MSVDEPAVQIGPVATQRAALRTMGARRRRVWRNIVLLVLVTAALLLWATLHRDGESVRQCRDNLSFAVRALERDHPQGALPLLLPLPSEEESFRKHFRYTPERAGRVEMVGTAVICYCDKPHVLYLRTDGRHVVTYDGKSFAFRWLPESEFRELAARLDLRLPAGP